MVKVVPYTSEWERIYLKESALILQNIGAYIKDLQHIGSTAVPGLSAKPIIDIGIAVGRLDKLEKIKAALESIGYEDRGYKGREGGHLFVKNQGPEVRTLHLHIVQINDDQWKDYIKFRDALRSDKKLSDKYSALKDSLAKYHTKDRSGYTTAKNEFIQKVLKGLGQ